MPDKTIIVLLLLYASLLCSLGFIFYVIDSLWGGGSDD